MKKIIVVVAVLVVAAEAPAAQAVWNAEDVGGGAEFRLANDEGAAIILVCQRGGVSAGFEFPTLPGPTHGASIRGLPGGDRQNVTVAPVNDHVFRVTSGRGLEALLRLLRGAPILNVRAGATRASFQVFGSAHIVHQCLQRQDAAYLGEVRRVRTDEEIAEARERQALERERRERERERRERQALERERRGRERERREPAPE